MNWLSEHFWVEVLRGTRKLLGNLCWALVVSLGSIGFLCVGTSSYLAKNLLSYEQINFFPQGIVMSFYGIAGFFVSSYLWCAIFWNVGRGYDKFDRKKGMVYLFRWGFPGKNRRTFFFFRVKEIEAIIIKVNKEDSYASRISIGIRGQGPIPLARTDENLTSQEIEEKAVELAHFLRVPMDIE
uniref:photosystem I assembly protein Ycf4 n=1 Tax=Littorella uniflora TaxID=223169 RepID=UPI0022388E1C|nr:photosystem I assembly protein Ycf4 [Littorella uniflora]QWL15623.1 photosystem I assembly protein Ycf4 [Littorella uniflora]UYG22635.1 photosystem I assembly protein Ycf4 [Littorella uniflora]